MKSRRVQSAGAVEYNDCISAKWEDSPSNKCPGYDIKPSNLELLRMCSTISLQITLGPFWPGVVATDRFLSMGQIELLGI